MMSRAPIGSRAWAEQRSVELIAACRSAVTERARLRAVDEFVRVNVGQASRIGVSLARSLGVRNPSEMEEIVAEVYAAIPKAMETWDPQLGPFGSWLIRWSHDAARRQVESRSGFGRGGSLAMRRAVAARRAVVSLGGAPSDDEIAIEVSKMRSSDPITAADVSLLRQRGLLDSRGVDFAGVEPVVADGESPQAVIELVDIVDRASVGEFAAMSAVFRCRFSIPDQPGVLVPWKEVERATGVGEMEATLLIFEARRLIAEELCAA